MLTARSRALAVSILCLSVAAACGSPELRPSTGPTPSPSTTTPVASGTSSGLVRVVGEEDAGTTVELRVGESLRVELGRDYQQPAAQPDGVLSRTSATGGYPTGKEMIATFRAVAAGNADVSSSTDYACLRSTPSCALPQQLWSVNVIVKR